jgi:SAM-dependent methyltransferase
MSFEQQYYEHPAFWHGEMLQDEANIRRFELTASYVPGDVKTLADIGCGNGVFLNYLKQVRGSLELLGVDRSAAALEFVAVNKMQGDVSSFGLPDRSYDCVSCLEVIEHLPRPVFDKSLEELTRVARKYLIVSVPYNENLEEGANQCPKCRTIFNLDLHLRSFRDDDMRSLFDKYKFKCVRIDKFGESHIYKGHYWYRKTFYREQFLKWKSPICPICGYEDVFEIKDGSMASGGQQSEGISMKQRILSSLSWLPKKMWPKEKKYYWIMGLYERVEDL